MKLKLTRRHFAILRKQLWRKWASRRIACPFCGGTKSRLVFKSPNVRAPIFRAYLAEKVVCCQDCRFVFTNPRLSAEDLEKYYSSDFQLEGLDVPRSKKEFLSDAYATIWNEKQRDLKNILSHKTDGRLLDLGCASGSLLYLAREKGFLTKGVDVAEPSVSFARKQLGLDVFCGQLEEACFGDEEFDVVTAIHSLEHVPNPARVLAEVNRILTPDGIFYGAVPNLNSWSAQEMGSEWKWLQPANHYSHFTCETLIQMFEAQGFSCDVFTEEGRYAKKEAPASHSPEETTRIESDNRGSEIIFVGTKTRSTAVISNS